MSDACPGRPCGACCDAFGVHCLLAGTGGRLLGRMRGLGTHACIPSWRGSSWSVVPVTVACLCVRAGLWLMLGSEESLDGLGRLWVERQKLVLGRRVFIGG